MGASNLPPGCSFRDIPGAVPSAAEALADELYELLAPLANETNETLIDEVVEKLSLFVEQAILVARHDARADETYAQEIEGGDLR